MLTSYALEAMGFREILNQGSISANFFSVTVYEINGIDIPKDFIHKKQGNAAGVKYQVAISTSINNGCRELTGDDFVESESEWLAQSKTKSPFLLVGIETPEFYPCSSGRVIRNADGSMTTYDSFPEARLALQSLEERVLPLIVASFSCGFSNLNHRVSLRKIARESIGKTSDLTPIHDMRMTMSLQLSSSYLIEEDDIANKLALAVSASSQFNKNAAHFYALGTQERDELKRFLYFFLSLEIETHAVFKRIDHETKISELTQNLSNGADATSKLLMIQASNLSNLFDKFVWCVTCTWNELTDDDIVLFKQFKGARDAIAHGGAHTPPTGFAESVEILARKILWRNRNNV